MNEFESDWISLSQSQSGERVFLSESERRKQGVWIQDGSVWIQHGRIQDGCHHQVESEWMSEVFFVQMAEFKICHHQVWVRMNEWSLFWRWPEFKMAAIIKLSQNSMSEVAIMQVESEVNEFESDWEPILASVSEFERENWDGRIHDGRIQDGCHHQVKWEWMSLSQIELVWVRVRVEWECFLSESERRKQGVWIQDGSVWNQHGRIQDGCHHQVESEWMSLTQIQVVWERVFVQNGWIQDRRIQDGQNSRWLPSSS